MRNFNSYFKFILISLMMGLMFACEADGTDPCDETIASTPTNASIMLSVIVERPSGLVINGQQVLVEIYKEPCGGGKSGVLTSSGFTGSNGIYNALTANYQLRNLQDKIVVNVEAPGLNNDASKDIVTSFYYPGDFNSGQILFLDILMTRDY